MLSRKGKKQKLLQNSDHGRYGTLLRFIL